MTISPRRTYNRAAPHHIRPRRARLCHGKPRRPAFFIFYWSRTLFHCYLSLSGHITPRVVDAGIIGLRLDGRGACENKLGRGRQVMLRVSREPRQIQRGV